MNRLLPGRGEERRGDPSSTSPPPSQGRFFSCLYKCSSSNLKKKTSSFSFFLISKSLLTDILQPMIKSITRNCYNNKAYKNTSTVLMYPEGTETSNCCKSFFAGGDGRARMGVSLMPLNWAPQNGFKMVKINVIGFYHTKKFCFHFYNIPVETLESLGSHCLLSILRCYDL